MGIKSLLSLKITRAPWGCFPAQQLHKTHPHVFVLPFHVSCKEHFRDFNNTILLFI